MAENSEGTRLWRVCHLGNPPPPSGSFGPLGGKGQEDTLSTVVEDEEPWWQRGCTGDFKLAPHCIPLSHDRFLPNIKG